jgi:chorismate mutase
MGTASGSFSVAERHESGYVSVENSEPDTNVRQVVKQAHQELIHLLRQRAELMRRIGTLKQTIAGLANLFGNEVLSDELMALVGEQPKETNRHPGFTNACRMVLIESARPMSARDVCEKIREKIPPMLTRHRDPVASVTTVMNRLANYGEAETVMSNGRRAWKWIAEPAAQ